MIIDCDTCEVRGVACDDCVVTVLLGLPARRDLDDPEARALEALADGGLVPPLRMQPPVPQSGRTPAAPAPDRGRPPFRRVG